MTENKKPPLDYKEGFKKVIEKTIMPILVLILQYVVLHWFLHKFE
jgi:hypothetical protein